MAAIHKHVQRTQPKAVVVLTEDSPTSHVAVEAYDSGSKVRAKDAAEIMEKLHRHNVPTTSQTAYGYESCQQWADRLQKAGLDKKTQTPIVFLHIPPSLSESTAYNRDPCLEAKISAEGAGVAISHLASTLAPPPRLEGTKAHNI